MPYELTEASAVKFGIKAVIKNNLLVVASKDVLYVYTLTMDNQVKLVQQILLDQFTGMDIHTLYIGTVTSDFSIIAIVKDPE